MASRQPAAAAELSKFHLSLNVHDLAGAAAFLEILLDRKPAQLHSDYAKFELAEPPLVLSLAPTDVAASPGLNHLGFRLPSRQALAALQQRLLQAGIPFDAEDSVACCHSRQTKLWVRDPAGNLWEFYVLEEPGDCDSTPAIVAPQTNRAESKAPTIRAWAHRLGEPLPVRIPADDGSLEAVVLEGTFNALPCDGQPAQLLSESFRALCNGGKLKARGLTADRPLSHPPALPEPAAAVEHVPTTCEVLDAIRKAGFVGLEMPTFGETYRFMHASAELRETRIHAWRVGDENSPREYLVIYRGPFSDVRDDSGLVFRRGEPTAVDELVLQRLQQSSCAASFVFQPLLRPHQSNKKYIQCS